MNSRRDRVREVLADSYEAAGYGDEAAALRAGIWTCHDHPALAAMLVFADAELERAAAIALQTNLSGFRLGEAQVYIAKEILAIKETE